MGQKSSSLSRPSTKPRLSLTWVLRTQRATQNPNPEQPIKFQYKARRRSVESTRDNKQKPQNDKENKACQTNKPSQNKLQQGNIPSQNKLSQGKPSENNKSGIKSSPVDKLKVRNVEPPMRTKSEPSLNTGREKHRHRKRSSRAGRPDKSKFGYEIQDVDAFLAKVIVKNVKSLCIYLNLIWPTDLA